MSINNFEGTSVLEKLAEAGLIDQFYEAVDSDNFKKARVLMKQAGVDEVSILQVLNQMANGEDEFTYILKRMSKSIYVMDFS